MFDQARAELVWLVQDGYVETRAELERANLRLDYRSDQCAVLIGVHLGMSEVNVRIGPRSITWLSGGAVDLLYALKMRAPPTGGPPAESGLCAAVAQLVSGLPGWAGRPSALRACRRLVEVRRGRCRSDESERRRTRRATRADRPRHRGVGPAGARGALAGRASTPATRLLSAVAPTDQPWPLRPKAADGTTARSTAPRAVSDRRAGDRGAAYRASAKITRCVHGLCCPVNAPDDAPRLLSLRAPIDLYRHSVGNL